MITTYIPHRCLPKSQEFWPVTVFEFHFFVRTLLSIFVSYDESEGSYDDCDVEFSVLEDLEHLCEGMSKKDTCEVIQYGPKSNIL